MISYPLIFNELTNFTVSKEPVSLKKNKTASAPLMGSILGSAAASYLVVKYSKNSGNLLKRIIETDFSKSRNIFLIAFSAIAGGFLAGTIKDGVKSVKEKAKEANFQLLSNIVFPLAFLNGFKHVSKKISHNLSQPAKKVANIASIVIGVALGALSGAKVANKINNKLDKTNDSKERKLGFKDFLVHIDDLPMILGVSGVPLVDKIIPIVLITRGYEVGKSK